MFRYLSTFLAASQYFEYFFFIYLICLFDFRSIHDVKATDMGIDTIRFKAEINFDGREITRVHLNRLDTDVLLRVSSTRDSKIHKYHSLIFIYISVVNLGMLICYDITNLSIDVNKLDIFFILVFFYIYIKEVNKIKTTSELEMFILEHGEQIIDVLGSQVDRIERNIKVTVIKKYVF